MASTYTYQNALSLIQKAHPRLEEGQFHPAICNMATNLIWNAFDWRESLVTLPPFYLIPGEQDHYSPGVLIPSDFHGLRQATLIELSPPTFHERRLLVTKDSEETNVQNIPHAISYEASKNAFRLFPRVPENLVSPRWLVKGTYKKRPTLIQNNTLSTILPWDDIYINVVVESMIWAAKKLSGSQDAGDAVLNSGQKIYTGQLGRAMAAIEDMASNEGIQDGSPVFAPTEDLYNQGIRGNFW